MALNTTPERAPFRLILASGSPYRARLLSRLGIPFDVLVPDIDETGGDGEPAAALAERLAQEKSLAVDPGSDDALVIGSDQVAACGDRLLGKPGTEANAREQLGFCAGRTVTFYTGLSLQRPRTGYAWTGHETYAVAVRRLTDAEIARYVALDQPLDCAGSFKWEALGISLFDAMSGTDPTTLEGLPLIRLAAALRAQGFALP